MNIWNKIKRISFLKLLQFGWLLLQKPRLIFPIWEATKETITTSNSLYGNAHHGRGKANAFKHAYWNYQICQKTLKFTKNASKSAKWTNKIVDFYEKVTKNDPTDQQMDFHNNAFGRNYFLQKNTENQSKSIDFLQEMTRNAQKVSKLEDFSKFKEQLVYITE